MGRPGQDALSAIYSWRDAKLCESRGPTGEFCQHEIGHDGGHRADKGTGCIIWVKDYPYWYGGRWVRP